MKLLTVTAVLAASIASLVAKLQPAYLVMPDETYAQVFLEAADEKTVWYRETERAVNRKSALRSSLASIYLFEPEEFRQAMDAFRRRQYADALSGFEAVREEYKTLEELPNNYASRAEFFACECLRLMGKYEEMVKRKATYRFLGLVHEGEKRQLELYTFWEAYHNQSWRRLSVLGKEWMEKPLPGVETAQVAFCYGVALGKLEQLNPALLALGSAVTADANPRKEISRRALIESMDLLMADPDFQREREAWGTDEAIEGSIGQARVVDAARMAKYYKSLFVTDNQLDSKYEELLEYLPEDEQDED